jgi:DNA polymerase-3 subunit gamma/tau
MEQALYRKWRPRKWDEVVGQEHIVQTLRNAVVGERVAHAYLFAGPRGTGKTTTARLLAKAVNCLAQALEDRPCDACAHCTAVNEGRFLDLIEIDAASNTSVEDVRDLRDKINFSPNEGRYKIYIIDEVHMLSTQAFNALLKTLEEPPEHALFVLATTEVHKIPATVLSRCQRHEFRRLPVATMVTYLEEKVAQEGFTFQGDALELIARQATGSMRDAISLVDQLASLDQEVTLERARQVMGTVAYQSVRQVVATLIAGEISRGLELINEALDGGADPRQFARQVVDYLRGLLLVRMGNSDLVEAPADVLEEMQREADEIPLDRLLGAIDAFSDAATEKLTGWQPSLSLELALVETIEQEGEQTASRSPRGNAQQAVERGGHARVSEPPRSASPQGPKKKKSKEPKRSRSTSLRSQPSELSFQRVADRWQEILSSVRSRDPRTQALLNSCRPLGVESGDVVVGFGSDLLREKMEKGHNLSVVLEALHDVLGLKTGLRCVLTEVWRTKQEEPAVAAPMEESGMVATAVRDLGAQVVDVESLPPEVGPST